jgi:serine/threonine protein phosphatase 1
MPDASLPPVYAIGDIHGEIHLLNRLLGRVVEDARACGVSGRPRLVFLGDYGDRGVNSKAVYDKLSSPAFAEEFDAVFVKGNHEQMLVDAERDPSTSMLWLNNGGAEFVESYGFAFRRAPSDVLPEFFSAFPPAHRAFLARMRPWHQEGGYLFVHAGIDPLRPSNRDPDVLMWMREPFLSCTEDYGFKVVHGHTPAPSVVIRANRIGVDTGCGHHPSDPLSAVALHGDSGLVRIIDTRH